MSLTIIFMWKESIKIYSPRTNRRLPTQSHHPSGQSWKKDSYKSLKTLVDKNAVLNFICQRDMSLTCFARHTSSSPGTARHNFQSKDNEKLFETHGKMGFKQRRILWTRVVPSSPAEQQPHQEPSPSSFETFFGIEDAFKVDPSPDKRIQLWINFPLLCSNNCQDHPNLVRWPGV